MKLLSETSPLGVSAPLGSCQHDRRLSAGQGFCQRPRSRRCLLKGCEQFYQPPNPQARYCSPACRHAAERWRRWRSSQTWRQTEGGRQCRRRQSCRYRQRVRQRPEVESEPISEPSEEVREGQRPAADSETSCCGRPGCYELFVLMRRSPQQRFCSCLCRQALRRVHQREARWGRRRKREPTSHRRRPP